MKKILIFTLLLLSTFIIVPPTKSEGAHGEGLPEYYIEARTPRYMYRTNKNNVLNKIILEVETLPSQADQTSFVTVKLYNIDYEFQGYLTAPRAVTVTGTLTTVEFSLASLVLEDEEIVFYTIEVDYAVVMRGAIMEYPDHTPSGLFTEFSHFVYNDVSETQYDVQHHQDDFLVIHYRINSDTATAEERTNKIRLFDFISGVPLAEYTRAMIFDIQGSVENFDVVTTPQIGDDAFIVLSKDYKALLDNPLAPYGESGLTYNNPNGLSTLENSHLDVFLLEEITSDVIYLSDTTRFYSPNPFIFRISQPIFKDGEITLNAILSTDYPDGYIETTDLKDNSQPLSVDASLYDQDIYYTYDVAETLNEGDTVGVTWTLTTVNGDIVTIYDTYTVEGSSDAVVKFMSFLDYHGLSNGSGKIFVSFLLILIVNIMITIFVPSGIVYAISNMSIIGLLSFMGFIPEYLLIVSALIIAMMFIRSMVTGGETYE